MAGGRGASGEKAEKVSCLQGRAERQCLQGRNRITSPPGLGKCLREAGLETEAEMNDMGWRGSGLERERERDALGWERKRSDPGDHMMVSLTDPHSLQPPKNPVHLVRGIPFPSVVPSACVLKVTTHSAAV